MAHKDEEILIIFVSNYFLCQAMAQRASDFSSDNSCILSLQLVPIYSASILTSYSNSLASYCADVYRTSCRSPIHIKSIVTRVIEDILGKHCIDIAITTSSSKHLEKAAKRARVPLLSTEFGPLPRLAYPGNRFISLDGHATSIFSSFKNLEILYKNLANKYRKSKKTMMTHKRFVRRYRNCMKMHPENEGIRDFFSNQIKEKKVACLALQHNEWITWEGSLKENTYPREAIYKALALMESDLLIVTTKPQFASILDCTILQEISMGDPRLLILPEHLRSSPTELLLMYADELIAISSNVAFAAFMLGIKVKGIGCSFPKLFERISGKSFRFKKRFITAEIATCSLIFNKYSISDQDFRDPIILSKRIQILLAEKSALPTGKVIKSIARFFGLHCTDKIVEASLGKG